MKRFRPNKRRRSRSPIMLAILSALTAIVLGVFTNIATGAFSSPSAWAVVLLVSLCVAVLTVWQANAQQQVEFRHTTLLQEVMVQTYLIMLLFHERDEKSPAFSSHRIRRILETLDIEQKSSLIRFFHEQQLAAPFLGRCLRKTDLREVDLQDISLPDADLEEADLSGADMRGTVLHRANLKNANLAQTTLDRVDFKQADLRGSHWRVDRPRFVLWEDRWEIREANFQAAKLSGVDLHLLDFQRCDFSNALLVNTNFSEVRFHECNFSGASLKHVNCTTVDLTGADLHGADLQYAQLHFVDLTGADLHGTNLQYAQLQSVVSSIRKLGGLAQTIVHITRLSGANMQEACLFHADLRRADLTNTNLRGAHLEGADLRDANLEGADLTDADLHGAHLEGANLKSVIITDAQFQRMTSSSPSQRHCPVSHQLK